MNAHLKDRFYMVSDHYRLSGHGKKDEKQTNKLLNPLKPFNEQVMVKIAFDRPENMFNQLDEKKPRMRFLSRPNLVLYGILMTQVNLT